jgi:endonuclease YncB( thermonuclease family)
MGGSQSERRNRRRPVEQIVASPSVRRTRPLWRTLVDAAVFAAVLLMVATILDYFNVVSLTPGKFKAVDGDSLRRGSQELRLYGIDAPELDQTCTDGQGRQYPCGREAAKALAELVSSQTLDCERRDTDRYGRIVATCEAGGIQINREMVRLGWAVNYDKYGFAYVLAERDARKSQRGIWYGDFELPQDYRARHRINKSDMAGLETADD